MNPMVIAQLTAQFLPYGIKFAQAMVTIIHKKNPTLEDWTAVLDLAQTPFDQGLKPGALIPDPSAGSTVTTEKTVVTTT